MICARQASAWKADDPNAPCCGQPSAGQRDTLPRLEMDACCESRVSRRASFSSGPEVILRTIIGASILAMDHPPRLVLDDARPGRHLALDPEDIQHLVKVLRLQSGAAVEVLDGRGRCFTGTLGLERRGATVAVGGAIREALEPGASGSGMPRVEVLAPWPKGTRAGEAVGRLAQLGVAAWQPLVTAYTEAEARGDGEGRREKLARVAREALKQCGGLHAMEVRRALELSEAVRGATTPPTVGMEAVLPMAPSDTGRTLVQAVPGRLPYCNFVLDPKAPVWISNQLLAELENRRGGAAGSGFRLWAGPEAGFSPAELEALREAGFAFVRLSSAVLRIETALEAAAAIVLERCAAADRP